MIEDKNLQDLEMAKKRDHKITITEEAIKKVPRIQYREISEEHYDVLQELAKKVLIASKEKNDCNEVAITYSLDSTELFLSGRQYVAIAYGDEHSVDPMSDTASNHLLVSAYDCVVVILHNHPSLSKISLQDIQYLLRFSTVKMIVAVTNLGSISYVVKTNNYNRRNAIDLYNDSASLYNSSSDLKGNQKASDFFLNNCYKAGCIYEDH